MKLRVQHLPVGQVTPNPWNPNRQTDRQYRAEVESLTLYGFVSPIVVRPHDGGWQIIDGEHRLRALRELAGDPPHPLHPALKETLAAQTIPAVVLDLTDEEAKKLTVVLNETRGKADSILLGTLLAELGEVMDMDALIEALPYSPEEVTDLIAVAAYDWDALGGDDDDLEPDDDALWARIVAIVEPEVYEVWTRRVTELRAELNLPRDDKRANGVMLARLLEKEAVSS